MFFKFLSAKSSCGKKKGGYCALCLILSAAIDQQPQRTVRKRKSSIPSPTEI